MKIYSLLFFILCVSVFAEDDLKTSAPSYTRPYIDSIENSSTTRIQQDFTSGSILSKNRPNLYETELRLTQSCPNNCTSEENGFCDKRSGYCYCKKGYTGKSCERCINSYYMSNDNTCKPKILCPDNCNYGGSCNYETGECICNANRYGDRCERNKCQEFSDHCDKCNSERCTECAIGFYLDTSATKENNNSCISCAVYDPRCYTCTEKECTYCADTLRNTLRIDEMNGKMSGNIYPELPTYFEDDEFNQLLSYVYPMNKHDGKYFDDSEAYYVVDVNESGYLNDSSKSCVQGKSNDASWECINKPVINRVCGTLGLFYIPHFMHEIAILENEPFLSITVRRTGGGLGESSIDYMLYHKTASPSDISPNTFYTVNQTLYFEEGVVEKNISLTLHDDLLYEGNETVYFILFNASDGAGLLSVNSNYTWSNITIIDNDADYLNNAEIKFYNLTTGSLLESENNNNGNNNKIDRSKYYKAGEMNELTITFSIEKIPLYILERDTTGEDDEMTMIMEVPHQVQYNMFSSTSFTPPIDGNCTKGEGNEFICKFNTTGSGVIPFSFYILKPNGLNRNYYVNDDFNSESIISHVDRYINLSYPLVTTMSIESSPLCIQYKSVLKPPETGNYEFIITTSGYTRLWINDILMVDNWFDISFNTTVNVDLTANKFTNFLLRYKHGGDSVDLSVSWKIPGKKYEEIIHPSYFYWYSELANSPQYIKIFPNYPDTFYSTALRLGAVNCVSGSNCSFLILSRDQYQNIVTNESLALWNQTFENLYDIKMINNNDTNINITVTLSVDNENGIITGYYRPLVSGDYNLSITLLKPNGEEIGPIFGSPYQVTIGKGEPYPLNMNISFAEENTTFIVGNTYNFTVDVVDITFNALFNDDDDLYSNIDCYVLSFYKYSLTPCNINCFEYNNGTCVFDFTPMVSQNNSIIVTYSNTFIGNSPYYIDIQPDVFNVTKLYCMSTVQCYVNLRCDILYEMRDRFDNPTNEGFDLNKLNSTVVKINNNNLSIQDVKVNCTRVNSFYLQCNYIPTSAGNDRVIIHYEDESDAGTVVNLYRTPYTDGDENN